jgi:7-carboxy-7-deazaguanine synthase
MAFDGLLITEIFHSLQGETSLAGKRFAFIRLTGCNLRCSYCDTTYSFKGGTRMSLENVVEKVRSFNVTHALVTGGEPLLQRQTPALIEALLEEGYTVSVETHGEISLEKLAHLRPLAQSIVESAPNTTPQSTFSHRSSSHSSSSSTVESDPLLSSENCFKKSPPSPEKLKIIMDIKTPGSKMNRGYFKENLKWLRPSDEVKFVITSKEDYIWAKEILKEQQLTEKAGEVLFSAALPAQNTPGEYEGIEPQWLAERILEDRLPVRFQWQLHKLLWGDKKGT